MSIQSLPVMVTVVISMASPAWAQQPTTSDRLDLETYLHLEGVADPRLAPAASQIVYVREWIDP